MAASSSSSSSSASPCVSIGSSVYAVSDEKTNGTRLARLLIDVGTHVLRKFLHSIYPPETLENVLKKNRVRLQILKTKKVIFGHQWEKLFPPSGDPPDSSTFDITLLHLLIREVCYLPAPLTGWHKMPAEGEESLEANITRIKCFRNELCHSVSTGIPNSEFEDKWNKISTALEAIEIHVYREKIQGLKNDSIDHRTRQEVEIQVEQWRKQQEEAEPISEPRSYLPDKIPDERMFGRSQEVQQVKEYVQTGTVSVVVITGGPGFGKTTVAKAVAHELVKPENKQTVLFCSLLSKKTFNEVATEMIHSCGKISTQLPENPDQWLKDWSKQVQTQVTFVLDNADGVLESKDRNSFLSTLRAIRKLSKQKATFVVTSRKTLQDPDLPSKAVRLDPLSPEEAKKILLSRVNDEEIRKKLSKTEKIVELCGCVPLALCIVGSLLSDYTEERLVKHLEEEPMTLLKDDGESVQTAIKTSFDLLNKPEQDALVLMSVFPGSFDSSAAEAVIRACSDPGSLPIAILRSLKNRSLLEQPRSCRYQLHPLVRSFAKEIGQTKSEPPLLDEGEKLACAHFMSRLDENAKMYWSKDACKAAFESFSKERHNFENFLQVYAEGMENHHQGIVDSCKPFLDDFLQKCMYLEMCVSPEFYIHILERLLKSFNEPVIQPVRLVELMCLLGHEERKKGDRANYKASIEKAELLYTKNRTEFETNPLSEIFFLNSYADFLSKTGDAASNGLVMKHSETALKVCDEKLKEDHPERAATLLFAGRFSKRMRKRPEANQKLQEALILYQERLGKHVMTVHALKETGDFFFSFGTEENLEKALTHYKEALDMMKYLGMENSKENIHILKNYGVCSMRRRNYPEAMEYLERANIVAERELKPVHVWKVMIKEQLAMLHQNIASVEKAEENLEKACTHYKGALEMMRQPEMENINQDIKIRKDYGVCLMKKGNYLEAKECLELAHLAAERELESNHLWKVIIKIQLALLHEKIGKVKDAKLLMKEGLEMLYRRKMKIKQLPNSCDVLEFLDRHSEDFPEDAFTR